MSKLGRFGYAYVISFLYGRERGFLFGEKNINSREI